MQVPDARGDDALVDDWHTDRWSPGAHTANYDLLQALCTVPRLCIAGC